MEFNGNSAKLTDTFTVAVGDKLDREKLTAAITESGARVRLKDPLKPTMGTTDHRMDRLNITLDQTGIVTGLHKG